MADFEAVLPTSGLEGVSSPSARLGLFGSNVNHKELKEVDEFSKWIEGYTLLVVIIIGASANLFSLFIIRNRELNLIRDFSRLLQSQVIYLKV